MEHSHFCYKGSSNEMDVKTGALYLGLFSGIILEPVFELFYFKLSFPVFVHKNKSSH
jgi:hypothetical protein